MGPKKKKKKNFPKPTKKKTHANRNSSLMTKNTYFKLKGIRERFHDDNALWIKSIESHAW
jgi:hypothetical protein